MAKNEDGEYELVLGNHQLLGVFFIVVMLLAVMFALGYIVGVGRNASPVVAGDAGTRKAATNPIVVESPAARPRESAPAAADPAPEQPITTQPQTSAEPAKPRETPVASKPAPQAAGSQPVEGATYLQLTAIDQTTAELYVDKLRKKKFKAIAAEVPDKPGVFRVMVGPIAEGEINKTKTDLESAGFPGNKSMKRTF